MLEKNEILIVILLLLSAFYIVIFLGSGGKKKSLQSHQIKKYLFGVKILIIIITIVAVILWSFI
tara:strand:- start:642 stop:833 length:192 start_codon:yes stop_codon:yes gene_type:complete